MMRENGGWECFTMIVIENFPCENKMDSRIEEDRIMREMKAKMNSIRAYVSLEGKKECHKEYKKNYHQVNKEQIHEKKKEYHQANKEHICEKAKDYRLANRDKINEKQREKVECVCGCLIVKSTLTRHMITKRYLNNLK